MGSAEKFGYPSAVAVAVLMTCIPNFGWRFIFIFLKHSYAILHTIMYLFAYPPCNTDFTGGVRVQGHFPMPLEQFRVLLKNFSTGKDTMASRSDRNCDHPVMGPSCHVRACNALISGQWRVETEFLSDHKFVRWRRWDDMFVREEYDKP